MGLSIRPYLKVSPVSIASVSSVTLYRRDAKIGRTFAHRPAPGPTRSDVVEFTARSRKRLAFVANNTAANFTHMITLTYPAEFPADGPTCKAHLHRFLMWCRYSGVTDYLWWLEFQKRGAPHFHILTVGGLPYRDVAQKWFDAVKSLDGRHLAAGTRVERLRSADGGARYATKYASKMRQKRVPDDFGAVGRLWGHSRSVRPPQPLTINFKPRFALGVMYLLLFGSDLIITDAGSWSVIYAHADLIRANYERFFVPSSLDYVASTSGWGVSIDVPSPL